MKLGDHLAHMLNFNQSEQQQKRKMKTARMDTERLLADTTKRKWGEKREKSERERN